ncbi:MAG: DUF4345 family protein [Rhizobiaceae bacterium]|nr:DUF4345 family protein [Rhizobiaceae bacterium]
MEFAFPWPLSPGEWLAWSCAVITVLLGLFLLFAPTVGLRLYRLQTLPEHPEAVAGARANLAGFQIALGLCCILLAQPLLYIALGLAWALTGFGRLVSMLSDDGNTLYNWISLVIEIILALSALLFAFGLVP